MLVAGVFFSAAHSVSVRVLLGDSLQKERWIVGCQEGYQLYEGDCKKVFKQAKGDCVCNIEGSRLSINKTLFTGKKLWFVPAQGALCKVNGAFYEGKLLFIKEHKKWLVINTIPLEQYVFSVLKTESWPGWPLEINKALAIASRTYVLYQLLVARQKKLVYHIKNTNHHQTYSGFHTCPVIRQAVIETEGLFLEYQGLPILAMFDVCCGGIIPAKTRGIADFKKAPYLSRTQACTFCKDAKVFDWRISYDMACLADIFQEAYQHIIHDIKDVKITSKDAAGLVEKLHVKTSKKTLHVSAQKMYKMFKEIKSHCYSVIRKGKTITFQGRGYGHHLGLCQWGARAMVDAQWKYDAILAFYYPGTSLMKLS